MSSVTASPAPDPGNPADLQPGKTWKADMLAMLDNQNGEYYIWIINPNYSTFSLLLSAKQTYIS